MIIFTTAPIHGLEIKISREETVFPGYIIFIISAEPGANWAREIGRGEGRAMKLVWVGVFGDVRTWGRCFVQVIKCLWSSRLRMNGMCDHFFPQFLGYSG